MLLLAFAETIQLFPDGTLFIHVALILIMIWVLNRTLYRPINKVLEARDKSKGGRSGEAAGILSDVSEKDARYNRELLETRSQGYELIEKEQKAATIAREKQLASVKSEVAEKLDGGRDRIAEEAKVAQTAIGTDAEQMADSIAASILKG
jgi:F-type H+-transporting ATPase subunit b